MPEPVQDNPGRRENKERQGGEGDFPILVSVRHYIAHLFHGAHPHIFLCSIASGFYLMTSQVNKGVDTHLIYDT